MDRFTVYLVDDDAGVRKAVSRLLRARGYDVQSYSSPQEFLQQQDPAAAGCAVLDVAMPGLDSHWRQPVETFLDKLHVLDSRQFRVERVIGEQLVVGAALDDFAVAHDENLAGFADSA